MPKKKKLKMQPNVFDGQLTPPEIEAKKVAAMAFELFAPELPKWHKFQDTPNGFGGTQGGNDYFWWRSRYSEWLEDEISEFERRHKFDKIFKEIWLNYESEITRRDISIGLPEKAH